MFDNNSHTFYFVRYPLGAGGTHLSNIISLDETIAPRGTIKKDSYFEFLISSYQSKLSTAHLPGHCIISDHMWAKNLSTSYQHSASVHLGHAASFFWAKPLLDRFQNKKYILLTFTDIKSRQCILQREKSLFTTTTLNNKYYVEEMSYFYSTRIQESGKIDADINLAIETYLLFKPNITELVLLINQQYHLNIPVNQAQQLHDIWLPKVLN